MATQSLGAIQRELIFNSKLYNFPAYVKEADLPDTLCPVGLATNAYADVRNKELPVHTKAATYYSWLTYLNKQAEISSKLRPHIEARLQKQAGFWGIEGDIEALREKHASLHDAKTASLPDSAFALVWATDDGRKARHYSMTNPLEVKAACEAFHRYREHFGFRDRQTIAKKILDKAAEFGTLILPEERETLEKQAGMGIYEPQACAQAIMTRMNMVYAEINQTTKDGMRKTAQSVLDNPMLAMNPDNCAALCETLDVFDRMAGLTTKYAEGLPRPEDIVYANPFSTAADFVKSACELVTGTVFNREQFAKLALSSVRAVFGDEIAKDVTTGIRLDPEKMAEMASTFPRPDAEALERLMAEVSQLPILKHAQHASFSDKELADLAEVNRVVGSLTNS